MLSQLSPSNKCTYGREITLTFPSLRTSPIEMKRWLQETPHVGHLFTPFLFTIEVQISQFSEWRTHGGTSCVIKLPGVFSLGEERPVLGWFNKVYCQAFFGLGQGGLESTMITTTMRLQKPAVFF
jgi:hypothetical protein